MEQERATVAEIEPSPVFAAYRRGYDPEQVDRYIADQRRRLDDAMDRASESERRLAAAVGQLRELHRRVAMLESEDRSQTPPLDMLGERVQRILQEAWEGAFQLRQAAEHDVAKQREETEREVTQQREETERAVTQQREDTEREVAEMLETARRTIADERANAEREIAELLESGQRRALLMRAETERRRQAYLEQIQDDREQAVGQISYLYEQRQSAVSELARLKANLEATVAEMACSPIGVPSIGSGAARHRMSDVSRAPAVLPEDEADIDPATDPEEMASTPVSSSARSVSLPGIDPADTALIDATAMVRLLGPVVEPTSSEERVVTAEHEVLRPTHDGGLLTESPARVHARKRNSGGDSLRPRGDTLRSPRDQTESPSVFDFEDPDQPTTAD